MGYMDSFELWELLRLSYKLSPESFDHFKYSEYSEYSKYSKHFKRVENVESVRVLYELKEYNIEIEFNALQWPGGNIG